MRLNGLFFSTPVICTLARPSGFNVMEPFVSKGWMPAIIFKRLLLPTPLGPSNTLHKPCGKSMLRSWKRYVPSNYKLAFERDNPTGGWFAPDVADVICVDILRCFCGKLPVPTPALSGSGYGVVSGTNLSAYRLPPKSWCIISQKRFFCNILNRWVWESNHIKWKMECIINILDRYWL